MSVTGFKRTAPYEKAYERSLHPQRPMCNHAPYSHGMSREDRIFSSLVFSISCTYGQHVRIGAKEELTNIEYDDATLALILNQEVLERLVRGRFMRSDGVTLPNVAGVL